MPDKMDWCVASVMQQGKDKDAAYAICTASMKKSVNEMTVDELSAYKTFFIDDETPNAAGSISLETAEGLRFKYTPGLPPEDEDFKALWDSAYMADLPDSSFALMMGDQRSLPHHDKEGKVDAAHVRNALARLNQVKGASAEAKKKAKAHLEAHLGEMKKSTDAGEEMGEDEKHVVPSIPVYHEDIREKVSAAMDKQAQGMGMTYSPYWIHRTASDHVIAMHSQNGYQKVPYSMDKNGDVTLGDATPVEKHTQFIDKPVVGKIYLKTEKDGKVRWMAVSSTTDVDLDKQHFTEQAYAFSMKVHEQDKSYGELRLEHHPVSRVGLCDGQFLVRDKSDEGRTLLVETGVFDETPRAKNLVNSLRADTVDKYKVSIGYQYNPSKLVDGAYTDHVVIFERSVTAYPANVKTAIGVVSPGISTEEVKRVMDPRTHDSIVALIGADEAKKIADIETDGLRALYDMLDVKFKNTGEVKVPQNGEQAKENHTDQKAEGAKDTKDQAQVVTPIMAGLPAEIEVELPDGSRIKASKVEQVAPAAKLDEFQTAVMGMLKSMQTDIEGLKAGAKSQANMDPNAPRVVLYRATKAEANIVDQEDPLLKSKGVSDRGQFFDNFAGGDSVKVSARPAVGG